MADIEDVKRRLKRSVRIFLERGVKHPFSDEDDATGTIYDTTTDFWDTHTIPLKKGGKGRGAGGASIRGRIAHVFGREDWHNGRPRSDRDARDRDAWNDRDARNRDAWDDRDNRDDWNDRNARSRDAWNDRDVWDDSNVRDRDAWNDRDARNRNTWNDRDAWDDGGGSVRDGRRADRSYGAARRGGARSRRSRSSWDGGVLGRIGDRVSPLLATLRANLPINRGGAAAADAAYPSGTVSGLHRVSESARRANQVIRTRTVWIMLLLGVVSFTVLFWKLFDLQINQHAAMQSRASEQQTRSAVVSASRGSIMDRNGIALAMSATAETVNVSPQEIALFVTSQQEQIQQASDRAAARHEEYTPPQLLDQAYIARGLSRILDVDQAYIEKRMERTFSQYEPIKKKVEREEADQVRQFINGEIDAEGRVLTEKTASGKTVLIADHKSSPRELKGVWLAPDPKRYYPYNNIAANVVGFVNSDNVGGVGLEAKYESELAGVSGLTVTAKNGVGTELLYQFEQYYDPENGDNLSLTLDVTVQSYLERGLRGMIERCDAANGATGIIMNVNTGAILAMASCPSYDLNRYGVITDTLLLEQVEKRQAAILRSDYLTDEEYEAARQSVVTEAVNAQWRNKCIDSTYEPGSTFKPITLAAALEEGTITTESRFTCKGSVQVAGWTIRCSRTSGHGDQDLKTATANSCNPAFINIGLSLGTETYYKYLQAFGLMERTNVDMIGEARGIFASEKTFNSSDIYLASYAFGQTFNVTPLELIRAQAACVNGGYLLEPYIVEKVTDADGNVLKQHDATPIRQVISEETSAIVREVLEYVVATGTGKNGQVTGYRIGGKTGTADKTGTNKKNADGKPDLVVSFMCFAPADDPQYIMLLTLDTPSRNTGVHPSGGNMVAPVASQIMADVLPYLGVERDYSGEQPAVEDAAVRNVVGKSLAEAKETLEGLGFSCKTVGSGDTVTDQVPAGGAIVPNDAQIILYMGEEKPDALCVVPDLTGMTVSQANKALAEAGLILRVAGVAGHSDQGVTALSQDTAEGSQVRAGTVVTVQFGDRSMSD